MGTIALFEWRHKACIWTVHFSGLVARILLSCVVSWDVMGLAQLFNCMVTCTCICLHRQDDVTIAIGGLACLHRVHGLDDQ